MGIAPLEIIAILVVGLMLGTGLLLVIVLLAKKKGGSKQEVVNQEPEMTSEKGLPSPEEKKEILEMLAKKEIGKEEAENRLQGNS